MTKLVLVEFTKGFYDDRKVCAYIHYGTKDKPLDHLKKPVGTEQDASAFIADLEKVVVPIIKSGLKNSKYTVECVECENMIPRPFLSICRLDKMSLSDDGDLLQIRKLIEGTINKFNLEKVAGKRVSGSLFARASGAGETKEHKAEHKRSLRSGN